MKKVTFLLATLLIGDMMFTGCAKDPDPTPDPEPEPTPTTYSVVYEVANTNFGHTYTLSSCFKLDVTYTDANGESVTENGVTLPWSKAVEVEAPFHACMSGTFVYDEAELPDELVFGKCKGISIYQGNSLISGGLPGGTFTETTKEKFLQIVESNPDYVKFTVEDDI